MAEQFLKVLQIVRSPKQSKNDIHLFPSWRDTLPSQLTIGLVTRACLFAHGLPANAILAGLTDAAFKVHHQFSANHAFFLFFIHRAPRASLNPAF